MGLLLQNVVIDLNQQPIVLVDAIATGCSICKYSHLTSPTLIYRIHVEYEISAKYMVVSSTLQLNSLYY